MKLSELLLWFKNLPSVSLSRSVPIRIKGDRIIGGAGAMVFELKTACLPQIDCLPACCINDDGAIDLEAAVDPQKVFEDKQKENLRLLERAEAAIGKVPPYLPEKAICISPKMLAEILELSSMIEPEAIALFWEPPAPEAVLDEKRPPVGIRLIKDGKTAAKGVFAQLTINSAVDAEDGLKSERLEESDGDD